MRISYRLVANLEQTYCKIKLTNEMFVKRDEVTKQRSNKHFFKELNFELNSTRISCKLVANFEQTYCKVKLSSEMLVK